MKIAVTGGGSGGHLSPAIATIQKLRELNPTVKILYIGGRLGMEGARQPSIEQKVLPQTDIPHILIHAGKLRRRWSLSTLATLLGAIPGFFEALFHLLKFKPQVLFSTGGFVSVPVVFAAWLLKIPIFIHEQTAAVGLSNKVGALFARKIGVTFPSSKKEFPKDKTVMVGNPIRSQVLRAIEAKRKQTGRGISTLYITGGSQGSHLINEVVRQALPQLLRRAEVIHQCGENKVYNDYQCLKKETEKFPSNLKERYEIVRYVGPDRIGEVFEKADLLIGRPGANTVNETAALGIPAIFIPIPWVTHNEQYKNARILANEGSAVIIPQDELTPQRLIAEVDNMKENFEYFKTRALQVQSGVKTDAAYSLAHLLLKMR